MPLMQGVWTVLLVYENVTMAYTQFLVTPSQVIRDTSISANQIRYNFITIFKLLICFKIQFWV